MKNNITDGSKLLSDSLLAIEQPKPRQKLTHEFVDAAFRERGWELRSEFKHSKQKLHFRCNAGHNHQIMWNSFQQGAGCLYCAGSAQKTHEEVEAEFAARGWTLLSKYQNSGQKLDFICDKRHRHTIRWRDFQQGIGCAYCSGTAPKTHEEVEAEFAARGWTLLSNYKNNKQKLAFICSNGHTHSITWDSFQQGAGCLYCSGTAPKTHEEVEAEFAARGWTLLSNYKNNKQKLAFICSNGHRHAIRWDQFQRNVGCAYCVGKAPKTHEEVEAEFAARGFTLLSKFKHSKQKLNFICSQKHTHSITWSSFRQGKGCLYCSGKAQKTHEEVEAEFTARGWTLLSNYKNSSQKLAFICSKGHRHTISWASFRKNVQCGKCIPGGYSQDLPGRLYYVRFNFPNHAPLYKIGITNKTIKQRFEEERTTYTILLDEKHEDGSIPYKKEQTILKRYRKHKYAGKNILSHVGITECFTKDILGLDKGLAQLPLPLDIT
jgi:uncharacterized SAM-dependent methyltransferase